MMLYAGLYSSSVNYQSFVVINPLNRSTAVSEKIIFLSRQKIGGNRTNSFAILGCVMVRKNCKCAWLCGMITQFPKF